GLSPVGSPRDSGGRPLWLRPLSFGPRVVSPAVDLLIASANAARLAGRALRRLPGMRPPARAFRPWRFRRLPFRAAFRWLEQNLRGAAHAPLTGRMPFSRPLLYHPRNVALGALPPPLRQGGNHPPRAPVAP